MAGSSSKHSKHGKGSKEPQGPKKSKPVVVTGDKCSSCGRLKTETPLQGTFWETPCQMCWGNGCGNCADQGYVVQQNSGCTSLAEHYSTRP
ncbi:hypothetical protein LA080_013734 [Diaporthe eres]|nr:hypothetical protein LA080_013734 [Diaporthe eres]